MVYVLRSTGIPTLGTAENGNNIERRGGGVDIGIGYKDI